MKLYQVTTNNSVRYFGDVRNVRKYQNEHKFSSYTIVNLNAVLEESERVPLESFYWNVFAHCKFSDYMQWDGKFTNGQRKIAMAYERKALNKMSDTDYDRYFELSDVFANWENTKAELIEYLTLLDKYGLSIISAMICY